MAILDPAREAVAAVDGYVVAARERHRPKSPRGGRPRGEARLREIAANAEDVLRLFAADWEELLSLIDAYEEIHGPSVEALAADPEGFLEVIHPEDRPPVRRLTERLSAGEPTNLEYRVDPDRDYRRWV